MFILLVFIVVLGMLIFVHEFGHFIMARRSGMKVEEFGFGFPPRLFGVQFVSGKKNENFSEVESVEMERLDVKIGSEEIIRETMTEKIRSVSKTVPVGKWRFIWGNKSDDSEREKIDEDEIRENKYACGTVYSFNWIPFGGFVRIKGENGGLLNETDSFASKKPFIRIKVLSAGVIMNFLFAWFLISIVLMMGFPRSIETNEKIDPSKIDVQIAQVAPETPASEMGLKMGDVIVSVNGEKFLRVERVQNIIQENKGKDIVFEIRRGGEKLTLHGMPRIEYPENQGALGVALGEITLAQYSFFEAIIQGAVNTWQNMILMVSGVGMLLGNLFSGNSAGLQDVSGPLGIAYITGEITNLGLVYLLYFTAILSINLGVLNILPFPALDGGRVLFILIEKLKGSPVSQRVEGMFHQFGFLLLIFLMIAVTVHDFSKFNVIGKIMNLF